MDRVAPGSYQCANLTKYTQIDVMRMATRIQTESDTELLFFNITGTVSANFPDAIYTCYNIP